MPRAFKDRQQQKLYDSFMRDRPTRGGCVLSDSFFAGFNGIQGVRKGVATSLQRAAWLAGADTAKAGRRP